MQIHIILGTVLHAIIKCVSNGNGCCRSYRPPWSYPPASYGVKTACWEKIANYVESKLRESLRFKSLQWLKILKLNCQSIFVFAFSYQVTLVRPWEKLYLRIDVFLWALWTVKQTILVYYVSESSKSSSKE